MRWDLVVVDSGRPVGSVEYDGGSLKLAGAAAEVFVPLRGRLDDRALGEDLTENGWSNGYLMLAESEGQRARVAAEIDEISRALADLTDDEFEKYWTREEGVGRWATHAHPWTTLRNLLRQIPLKHGRGPRDPEGLASHYFKIVFGYWPGSRKGDNPVGPG